MKGISPFIASILLIAFVVAAGVMLSPWFSSFTWSQAKGIEYKSEGQIDCIFSSLDFTSSDIDYNFSTTPDWVNVTLDNTGSANLYDFQVILTVDGAAGIYDPASYSQKTSGDPLVPGGSMVLVTNLTVDYDDLAELQKVRIVAKNCPQEAKKEVTI